MWADEYRSDAHTSARAAAEVKHSFASVDRSNGEGIADRRRRFPYGLRQKLQPRLVIAESTSVSSRKSVQVLGIFKNFLLWGIKIDRERSIVMETSVKATSFGYCVS